MESDTLKLLKAFEKAGNADDINPETAVSAEESPLVLDEDTEDSEIISAFFARNETALTEVERRYGGVCESIARSLLRNNEDAKQCVNDSLLKLWDSVPPNRPAELLPYLARIVKNSALDRLRAMGREKRGGSTELVLEELAECVSGSERAEQSLETRELQAAINGFLAELKTSHRKMFLYRYWFCLEPSEIAAQLGTTEHTVNVTLCRIRKKIKAYLQKRGYDI